MSLKTSIEAAEQRGAIEMLDRIRGSLKEYPNCGGDIVVMKEVERIVSKAVAKIKKQLGVFGVRGNLVKDELKD